MVMISGLVTLPQVTNSEIYGGGGVPGGVSYRGDFRPDWSNFLAISRVFSKDTGLERVLVCSIGRGDGEGGVTCEPRL